MSDDNQVIVEEEVVGTGADASQTETKSEPAFKSVEEAVAALKQLQEERAKDAELLKKVRKYEKENKEKADAALKEQGKYKELFEQETKKREQLEAKARDSAVNSILKDELTKSGAKAVDTVMKLVDKGAIVIDEDGNVDSKSVAKVIRDLQKSDPVLFGEVDAAEAQAAKAAPTVKRAVEGARVSGFEAEIAAASTQKELNAVLKKYGMK